MTSRDPSNLGFTHPSVTGTIAKGSQPSSSLFGLPGRWGESLFLRPSVSTSLYLLFKRNPDSLPALQEQKACEEIL